MSFVTVSTLESYTVRQLREYARDNQVVGYSTALKKGGKAALLVHLVEMDAYAPSAEIQALAADLAAAYGTETPEEVDARYEQEAIAVAADAAKEVVAKADNFAPAAQAVAHLAPNPYVDALVFALKAIAGLLWGLAVCTYWCGFWTGTACRWVVRKTSQGWEQFGPQLAPVAIAAVLAVAVVLPSKQ